MNNQEFWVINISKKNVCLADLALTIPAGRKMNLLDKKHFSYTSEQLEKSAESGSLYAKQNKLKISFSHNLVKPKIKERFELSNQPIQTRKRTAVKLEEPKYDDWLYSDEHFAEEMTKEPDE